MFATYSVDWRPNEKLRIDTQYQLQSYERRSDGSPVGVRRIPRLKVEYQVSRPIFLRVIGEYDSRKQAALRDDSRTELPILIRDPATGLYAPSTAFERNRFRVDTLFSYQPTPGTVVFAGYSSLLTEPEVCDSVACDVQTTVFFSRSARSVSEKCEHAPSKPAPPAKTPRIRTSFRAKRGY